jgi:hypothetical protein
MNIDLNKYQHFVEKVTSQPSNDLTTFMSTLDRLDANMVLTLISHYLLQHVWV